MLLCPEDVTCSALCKHSVDECCDECEAPICNECMGTLKQRKPEMPAAALTNDMMTYSPPKEIYEHKATVMEMICASVCITSMVCFTSEKKYRGNHALDETVGGNQHRMSARGNETSFLLPWQDLLKQLHAREGMDDLADTASLPRTGEDLCNVVSILSRTSDGGDADTSLASLIHQAMVRRRVVVSLIRMLKN